MKTATFTSAITFRHMTGPMGNRQVSETTKNVYGKVTLKNDGKISISIHDRNWNSYQMNDHATKIAKEIVASDFNHPAITSLQSDDQGLIQILAQHTADLKIAYVQQCKDWALEQFISAQTLASKTQEELCVSYGIKFHFEDSYGSQILVVDGTEWKLKASKTQEQQMNAAKWSGIRARVQKAKDIIYIGQDKWIAKAEKDALEHYESSLSKLAARIEKKGLDISKMNVVHSGMGVNMNITLSDGVKSVKAWTIVAEGEIQRPHYRYLVK